MLNFENMPRVLLMAHTNKPASDLVSFGALTCTQAEIPIMGKKIPISGLSESAHHSTFEHNSYTFAIDQLPIGTGIDFGLHVSSPWYNTGQRSGRYCQEMFDVPPVELLSDQLWAFYGKSISEVEISKVMDYLTFCIDVFKKHTPAAREVCAELLREERPKASEEYVVGNAPKVSQEQLRGVIPVIFPTGLVFTVDFVTAISLYLAAWNPYMRYVTARMMEYIFTVDDSEEMRKIKDKVKSFERTEWSPTIIRENDINLCHDPIGRLLDVNFPDDVEYTPPRKEDVDIYDLLPVHPKYMGSSSINLQVLMQVSLATYGQDQRHRSIRRSEPKFTMDFYVPPLMERVEMDDDINEIMEMWEDLSQDLPESLATGIAPYNAMVRYVKSGDANGFIHDGVRRICWTAQQENYQVNINLREDLVRASAEDVRLISLVNVLTPPCYEDGICPETIRRCGRDRSKAARAGNYFPSRKV